MIFKVSYKTKREYSKLRGGLSMKHLSQELLADTVKRQRTKKEMTQEQVSERTGINRAMIGRIERQEYIPSIPQLESLSHILEFDIDTLFVDKMKPTVYTAFRGSNLTSQEQDGVDHLFEMMLAVKKQIMLRRTLHHE
jgi:transcriptional regulator with XRE-family HTH domain